MWISEYSWYTLWNSGIMLVQDGSLHCIVRIPASQPAAWDGIWVFLIAQMGLDGDWIFLCAFLLLKLPSPDFQRRVEPTIFLALTNNFSDFRGITDSQDNWGYEATALGRSSHKAINSHSKMAWVIPPVWTFCDGHDKSTRGVWKNRHINVWGFAIFVSG